MSWSEFPYGFIVAFFGTFGVCCLCAYALIR